MQAKKKVGGAMKILEAKNQRAKNKLQPAGARHSDKGKEENQHPKLGHERATEKTKHNLSEAGWQKKQL